MRFSEVSELSLNRANLVLYLQDHNVLPVSANCPKCDNEMNFSIGLMAFQCNKRILGYDAHKKKISRQCKGYVSIYRGTWFSRIRLPLEKAFQFVRLYLLLNPPREEFVMYELEISSRTFVDWSNFVRETLIDWCDDHISQLGGPDKVVEIDETHVGNRKYNRGRVLKGRWVFGAYERGSGTVRVQVVKDRTKSTLEKLITEWVEPGTLIISDGWKSYRRLGQLGYRHLWVNHSKNYVDPITGAHTQNIERAWREMKKYISKIGAVEDHFRGYLSEFQFKFRVERDSRMNEFFNSVAVHFPP